MSCPAAGGAHDDQLRSNEAHESQEATGAGAATAVLDRVTDALLGTPATLSGAVPTAEGGLHLRVRPTAWPEEGAASGVARAQVRVTRELCGAMPLVDVTHRTNALDGHPEIAVGLPGLRERAARAARAAKRHWVPRTLSAAATLSFAAALCLIVHQLLLAA